MNPTQRTLILQRWHVMQYEIITDYSQWRDSWLLDHAVGMFFAIMTAMQFVISKPGYGLSRRGVQT